MLCAAVVLLSGGCEKRSAGSATPQAAAEFAEIESMPMDPQDPMDKEWRQVIEHFAKEMDTGYASPTYGFTILHVAAMFNKAELVRCLLLDGADPNATTRYRSPENGEINGGDSAMELALADIAENPQGAAGIIATIDALLQGGAKAEVKGEFKTGMLATAITLCEHEEAVLHLMRNIRPERDAEAHLVAAWKGWADVLKQLLSTHPLSGEEAGRALFTTAAGAFRTGGKHGQCISLLLAQGAPINACDDAGRTPLFAAATTLLQAESTEAPHILAIIEQLLSAGADAAMPAQDEEYPGCSAYDILRMHPTALDELEKRGHKLVAPPLGFEPGSPALLSDVCKAIQRGLTADDIRPHFDAIAGIFTPTPEMEGAPIYTEALENAIVLLGQTDSRKATQLVSRMRLWQEPDSWLTHEHVSAAVLSAIGKTPEIVLPAELLQSTAQKLVGLGMSDEAATLVEWMGRDAEAAPMIERLKQDAAPAIRAGAWTATLLQRGLPAPRNGEISRWLKTHAAADTHAPALQKALLLTSLEELWTGDMPKAKQKQLIAAMRDIGAANAAAQYEQIANNLHDPEALDHIMAQPNDWKFELEIATAQFILQNEQVFLSPASPSL